MVHGFLIMQTLQSIIRLTCFCFGCLQKAAIKKMDVQATHEFLAELNVLTHVYHLNLVSDSLVYIFLAKNGILGIRFCTWFPFTFPQ